MKINHISQTIIEAIVVLTACSTPKEPELPISKPHSEGMLRVEVISDESSRAEFMGPDEAGNQHVAFTQGDDLLLWEVANVESRGYYYVRTHTSITAQHSEDRYAAQFTYSLPAPYRVGESYPGSSSYTTERLFYTGILPKSAFAGFWANYPVNDVDPSLSEGSDGFIRLNVPREQTPTATSPDKRAIILRASDATPDSDGVVRTKFQHLLAYMKITVKGLPAGYNFHHLAIGGDSRIVFANERDKFCKWSFGNANLYDGNGFDATNRGSMLTINTSHLQPEADGSYTLWAACIPYTGPYVATPAFTPYSSENDHIESKLIPISRTGLTEDGAKAVKLQMGRVAHFTLNYGYGNDLTAPDLTATTRNIDSSHSEVSFHWEPVGGADHYRYTINGGEEQTTTSTSLTLTVEPGQVVTLALKACPATDSDYTESGWSTKSITAESYRVALEMSEIDEGEVTSYCATLMWSPVEHAAGFAYKIGEDGASIAIGNVTSYTFTELEAERYYSIYLRALAEEGSSEYTHSEWVEKLILTSPKSPLEMGPISLVEVGERKVILSWSPVEGAASYRYCLQDGSEGVAQSGVAITGLEPESSYSIRIRAIAEAASDWSDSPWSDAVDFTTTLASNTYLWDSAFWADWQAELGSESLKADATYRGLSYTLGSGKGYTFMTESARCFVRSNGNADNGKNYFSFPATGNGLLRLTGRNDKGSDKTVRFILDKATISEPTVAASSEFTLEVPFTATEGQLIKIAPRDEKICLFTIEWIAE